MSDKQAETNEDSSIFRLQDGHNRNSVHVKDELKQ